MSEALNEKPSAVPVPVATTAGVTVDGRYNPPPEDRDGRTWIRTSARVLSDPMTLYSIWRDAERAPLWQEQIISVTPMGANKTHWVMRSKDKTIEWDAEVIKDEPGHRIVWRSVGGDSDNAGEVVFEKDPAGRGTLVTVLQEFRMGKFDSLWQTITGRNPRQAVIENLRHFKALAETGEIPRTQGQPHGPRGTIAGIKESLYGEKTPTPAGVQAKGGAR
jgi:uncharacterized membrane protein